MTEYTYPITISEDFKEELNQIAAKFEGFQKLRFRGFAHEKEDISFTTGERFLRPCISLSVFSDHMIKGERQTIYAHGLNAQSLKDNFYKKLKKTYEPDFENIENF